MEKVTVFCCDIFGTISCNKPSKERILNVKRFIYNLEKLNKIDNTDKLILSLFTSDTFAVSGQYYIELLKEFKQDIINMGPFFTEDIIIYPGCSVEKNVSISKLTNIKDCLEWLSLNKNITHSYYVDDSKLNVKLVDNLFIKCYSNINYKSFNPIGNIDDSLINTNKEIEYYIKKR